MPARESAAELREWTSQVDSEEGYQRFKDLVPHAAEWSAEDAMAEAMRFEDPYKRRDALMMLVRYWIDSLPAGSARDGAVYTLVSSIEREFPEAAMEWAQTIGDERQRDFAEHRIRKRLGR